MKHDQKYFFIRDDLNGQEVFGHKSQCLDGFFPAGEEEVQFYYGKNSNAGSKNYGKTVATLIQLRPELIKIEDDPESPVKQEGQE